MERQVRMRRSRGAERQRGMTLIEIMVVIVIMGMIASAVGLSVVEQMRVAKRQTAKADLQTIASGLKLFFSQKGKYPGSSEGLPALVAGSQLDVLPKDPWGNPYVYLLEGSSDFSVTSYGADGQPGGQGDDEDLVLRSPHREQQARQ